MGKKIVNLDDKQNSVEITLGGELWTIERVVMRLREMYGEYVTDAGKYLTRIQEMEDVEEINKLAEIYAHEKADKLDAMMEKLLTKNGYRYDKDWWADNVGDYHAMESFIVACLNKDSDEDGKKKEGPEAS